MSVTYATILFNNKMRGGKGRMMAYSTLMPPEIFVENVKGLFETNGEILLTLDAAQYRTDTGNIEGIRELLSRVTHGCIVTVSKLNRQVRLSSTARLGKALREMMPEAMTPQILTRHFKKSLESNRLKFEMLIGVNFNVLNPVTVVCFLCGQKVPLTNTGSLSTFNTHLRRKHQSSEIVGDVLAKLKEKEPGLLVEGLEQFYIVTEPGSEYMYM